MIASGRVLTFDVQGTTGPYLPRTVAAVRRVVMDELSPYFDVEDIPIQTSSVLGDLSHAISDWPYTSQPRIVTRADYGDIRDVDSIIAHAFYEATGELPTVTAQGAETGQGSADARTGFSITTALVLVVLALIAIAVLKVKA